MIFKKLISQPPSEPIDIAGFEKLFKEHYKPLCMLAYGWVKDMDTAEEIVQDFFYHFWKSKDTIQIKTSVNAYFYRAIHNRSMKYLRALEVRRKYAEKVIGEGQEGYSTTLQDIEARELQTIIDNTLAELPERYEAIFRMSRYEGLKYQEIAEALSISVKTVEAAMGKALALFRKKLGNYSEFAIK